MNEKDKPIAAVRYDRALHLGQLKSPLPAGCPEPQPTAAWPPENVALFERYRLWLEEGGASQAVINQHRIPMAGHVLGLTLKPHSQLDLERDFDKAMAYVEAKKLSDHWTNNCRHSLRWFRRFLSLERGLMVDEVNPTYGCIEQYQKGLPDWLLRYLEQYLHLRQANWRPFRLGQATYNYWAKHTRLWRWLFANGRIADGNNIAAVSNIKRRHLHDYMDAMLVQGYAVGSINLDLYSFQATLRFMQGRGCPIPQALLTVRGLKMPDSLPRFLTGEQVGRVRDDLERRVETTHTPAKRRDALLDKAVFYLLWQAGLRTCEVEELLLTDLNLGQKRLMVRQGKGLKDRTLYLTDVTIAAVEAYLPVRGTDGSDYLFLYRHKPLSKDLVRNRMKAAGKRAGVKVTPHMLRHTFATQLVNAGCRATTIQALLGHKRLNSTMIYARVHDQTVADDYYAAMSVIEAQMKLHLGTGEKPAPEMNGSNQRNSSPADLLTLTVALQTEPLTESQQAVVDELQCGLLALAESLNGKPKLFHQVVNEQATQMQPAVVGRPP